MDQLLADYHQQTKIKTEDLIDFSDFKKLFNIAIHDILYQVSSDDVEEWKRMANANNAQRVCEASTSTSAVQQMSGIETSSSSATISAASSGLPAARSCAPSSTFSEAYNHNSTGSNALDQNLPIPPLWDWIVSLRPIPVAEETGTLASSSEKQLNATPRKTALLLPEDVDLTSYEYLESALGSLSVLPLEVIVEKSLFSMFSSSYNLRRNVINNNNYTKSCPISMKRQPQNCFVAVRLSVA